MPGSGNLSFSEKAERSFEGEEDEGAAPRQDETKNLVRWKLFVSSCLSLFLSHSLPWSLSFSFPPTLPLSLSLFLSLSFLWFLSYSCCVSVSTVSSLSFYLYPLSLFLSQSFPSDFIRLIFNLSNILSSLLTFPASLFHALSFYLSCHSQLFSV